MDRALDLIPRIRQIDEVLEDTKVHHGIGEREGVRINHPSWREGC